MASSTKTPGIRLGDSLFALRESPGQDEFPNIGDSLYDRMWKRIVNLEFAPGTRLSDEALARDFGVSRTPMREALYRLSQVGLVTVNARRGFFVATLSRTDVDELYDMRTALEVFATRRVTPLLSDEDLAPLLERQRVARERATSLEPSAIEDFVNSDFLLHDKLASRLGNQRLRQALVDIKGQLSIVLLHMAQTPGYSLRAVEEHDRILTALQARDAEAAAAAMEAHLQGVKARALEQFHPAELAESNGQSS